MASRNDALPKVEAVKGEFRTRMPMGRNDGNRESVKKRSEHKVKPDEGRLTAKKRYRGDKRARLERDE